MKQLYLFFLSPIFRLVFVLAYCYNICLRCLAYVYFAFTVSHVFFAQPEKKSDCSKTNNTITESSTGGDSEYASTDDYDSDWGDSDYDPDWEDSDFPNDDLPTPTPTPLRWRWTFRDLRNLPEILRCIGLIWFLQNDWAITLLARFYWFFLLNQQPIFFCWRVFFCITYNRCTSFLRRIA
jgi:hypothetical protein